MFSYYIHLTTNALIIKATYIQLTNRKYNHTQFKVIPMQFHFYKNIKQEVQSGVLEDKATAIIMRFKK